MTEKTISQEEEQEGSEVDISSIYQQDNHSSKANSSEILKDRLARGDITIEEFNRINDTINPSNITEIKNPKNKKTTMLLAILPGFVGLQGLAHIYIGKKAIGIWLLILSMIGDILLMITPSAVDVFRMEESMIRGATSLQMIIGVGWLAIFVWQLYDVHKLYEQIALKSKDESKLSRTLRNIGATFSIIAGFVGILFLISFAANMIH